MKSGKIYKIISDSTCKIYVGSTVKTLEQHLEEHQENYANWFNSEFNGNYCTSFEILKYGDYKIELLEDYPCFFTRELLKLEGCYQLQNYSLCVNIVIAGKNQLDFKNFKFDDCYICSCGKKMRNKYKTRRYHTKSESHKLKIKEAHLKMIINNPKFEVSMIG